MVGTPWQNHVIWNEKTVFPSQQFTKHFLTSPSQNLVLAIKRGISNEGFSPSDEAESFHYEKRILKHHGKHTAGFLISSMETRRINSAVALGRPLNSSVSSYVKTGIIRFTTEWQQPIK